MKIGAFDAGIAEHRRKASYIAIMVAVALPILFLPWLESTYTGGETRPFSTWIVRFTERGYGSNGFSEGLWIDVKTVLAVSAVLLLAAGITLVLSPKASDGPKQS